MTDSIAKSALAWLLTYAMHSTLLLGLAWAITRRRSITAMTRDFIWKTALVGGVVTSFAQTQLGVRPNGSFALEPAIASTPIASPDRAHEKTSDASASEVGVAKHEANSDNSESSPPASRSFASGLTMEVAVVTAWMVLAALLALFYLARRLILVGRLANRRAVTDGPLPAMLDSLCRSVGYRTQVTLTSANTISSPVALGMREICVPDAALTDLEPDQQRGLLAHELAHLARRDPLWLDAASLMERVFFFQPLNRVARRELQCNAEYLCDDWAATKTGSGLPLAHCLARVAEWIEASPLGVPVAGMAEQRSLLVTRIARLIEGKSASSPVSKLVLGGASLLFLTAMTAAAPGVQSRALSMAALTPGYQSSVATRFGSESATPAQDQSQDPVVIAALIERLKDTDAGVRRAAASSLGNLKSRKAVAPLIAVLADRNKEVRAAAVEALANIEDPSAVSALARMIGDDSPEVRERVLDALGRFSDEVKASQILPALQDVRPGVRAKAAELLGEIGDQSAVASLVKLLKDTSAEVRHETLHALEHLKDRSVGPAILPSLHDEDSDVRGAALEALRELKVTVPEKDILTALEDSKADVRKIALEYVKENPSASMVPTLKKLLEDVDSDVRQEAVEALSEIRDPSARAALRSALNSEDPKVRRRAVEALGERP